MTLCQHLATVVYKVKSYSNTAHEQMHTEQGQYHVKRNKKVSDPVEKNIQNIEGSLKIENHIQILLQLTDYMNSSL